MFRTLKRPLQEIKKTSVDQKNYWKPVLSVYKETFIEIRKKTKQASKPLTEKEMHDTWGINNDKELKKIIKGLTIEKYLYILLALIPLLFFMLYDYKIAALYFVMMPLFGIAALTKEWRLMCLKKRRFTPFKQWVMSGCQ